MKTITQTVRNLSVTAEIRPFHEVVAKLLRAIDADLLYFNGSWEDHLIRRAILALRDRYSCLAKPSDVAEQARLVSLIKNLKEEKK